MKMIKLLKTGVVFLSFSFIVFCTACNKPGKDIKDLDKLTKLLEPINVLGDSFELELANKDKKGNKENRYNLSKPANFEKYVLVVEFNATNRQELVNAYANYLREGGEEVHLLKGEDKNLSAFYSIARENNKVYLFISKFTDDAAGKILKNEYVLQLSKQQDNSTSIQQVVNNFMKTDMINIRPIIIEKQGNITNVRSY